jgi:hypothetical protein
VDQTVWNERSRPTNAYLLANNIGKQSTGILDDGSNIKRVIDFTPRLWLRPPFLVKWAAEGTAIAMWQRGDAVSADKQTQVITKLRRQLIPAMLKRIFCWGWPVLQDSVVTVTKPVPFGTSAKQRTTEACLGGH